MLTIMQTKPTDINQCQVTIKRHECCCNFFLSNVQQENLYSKEHFKEFLFISTSRY